MVVESLIDFVKAEKKPWEMFFMGFVYSSLANLMALWVFEKNADMVAVFLTVLAAVPLLYQATKDEEEVDITYSSEWSILKRHKKIISFLMWMFFGITISTVFWFLFSPNEQLKLLYDTQALTINTINTPTGSFHVSIIDFSRIFLNNLQVLIFSLLFSFIYAVGALFVLTWNATVIGVAIGSFARQILSEYATSVGLAKFGGYLHGISFGFFRYALHGIPEILAYFVAGLAGGILSFAIIRKDFLGQNFEKVLIDVADLLIISMVILLIAGILEVYVTPVFF